MTPFREDATLVLPEPPEQVSDLGVLDTGPAVVRPARAAPFLVEGRLASVVGSQTGEIEEVRIGNRLVARELQADVGRAANIVALPGVMRRERIGTRGSTLETVVALPDLPLVAVQWQGSEAGFAGEITLALHATRELPRGRLGPSSLVIDTCSEGIVAVGVSPPPRRLWMDHTEAGFVRVRANPSCSGRVTMLIAFGPGRRVISAFAAASHLAAHTQRAVEATLEGGLVATSGVAEIDDGVHWMRARLSSAIARAWLRAERVSSVVWCALAAIAASDRRAATEGLELARGSSDTDVDLLLRAYAMAFGGNTRPAPTRTSLEGEGRLPMARGATPRRSRQAWIATLLAGEPRAPPPPPRSGAEEEIYTLTSLFRTNPDLAWTRWRSSLATGLDSGPVGPGTWDRPHDGGPFLLPTTAGLLLALAHGLLGLSPDAPTGRIRLAPRLPKHLTRFGVDGLTIGDATIQLDYEREGASHMFTLEPTRAAVPPMAVFEPAVGGRVREVLIDGVSVDLDLRALSAGTVVPVQLPLHGTRRVQILAE